MMVFGVGINDMPKGWKIENNWNYKVYQKWQDMIRRCYYEKEQKRRPTYKDCIVCKRWLTLSNFVEDISKIDGYNESLFLNGELTLDKDVKSNGTIKEYSLENCMFITKSENSRQARKTTNYDYDQGKNNPRARKAAQYDKQGNLIGIWDYGKQASEKLKIDSSSISACCRGKRKSAGGYVWRYYEE